MAGTPTIPKAEALPTALPLDVTADSQEDIGDLPPTDTTRTV